MFYERGRKSSKGSEAMVQSILWLNKPQHSIKIEVWETWSFAGILYEFMNIELFDNKTFYFMKKNCWRCVKRLTLSPAHFEFVYASGGEM